MAAQTSWVSEVPQSSITDPSKSISQRECLCPWSVLNSGQPGASHRVERSEIQEQRDCESGIAAMVVLREKVLVQF